MRDIKKKDGWMEGMDTRKWDSEGEKSRFQTLVLQIII